MMLITVIPWNEFVACPEIRGMLLQVRRTRRQGDLWGEIQEIAYDGRELVVSFSGMLSGDPQKGRVMRTEAVEPVRILPDLSGPVYTEHVAFATRDLHTGFECFIRHLGVMRMLSKGDLATTTTR